MTTSSPFNRLFAAAAGAHSADQLMLAGLPLTAALLFHMNPGQIGLLVALQSAAWLVLSLPSGVLVDRFGRAGLLAASQVATATALALAALAIAIDSEWLLGFTVFVGSGGTVLFTLTTNSIVRDLVAPAGLQAANARVELARAVATLAAPAIAGAALTHVPGAALYILATAAAAAAAVAALGLRGRIPALPIAKSASFLTAIREGFAFLLDEPLLRAIAVCSLFFNFAFFVLVAAFVPFALNVIGLNASETGFVQAGLGAGYILGAASAGWIMRHTPPNLVLVVGPISSTLAVGLLLLGAWEHGPVAPAAGYFLIGLVPMMWQICQTSLRQLVTPAHLLGRVGATIQTAIYGVRPLGALAGGFTAAQFGPTAAIVLVGVCFGISALIAVFSPLSGLRAYPVPAAG